MKNARLTYLYRDGGNYKRWGEVIFSNLEGLPMESTTTFIRDAVTDDLFIARQVRLPEAFIDDGHLTIDDHCFHEFYSLAATDEPYTDHFGRSLKDFVNELRTEAQRGWLTFDVCAMH